MKYLTRQGIISLTVMATMLFLTACSSTGHRNQEGSEGPEHYHRFLESVEKKADQR